MEPHLLARQPRRHVEIPSIHNSRESEVAHNDLENGFMQEGVVFREGRPEIATEKRVSRKV